MILADFSYPVYALLLYWSQTLTLFGFPIFWYWASPDENYSIKTSGAVNLISSFLLLSLDQYHYWWTISPRMYHPLSSQHGNGLCNVRYDFRITLMFGSSRSLSPVVFRNLIYVIYVCLRIICWVFCFARLRLVSYVPNVANFSGSSIL